VIPSLDTWQPEKNARLRFGKSFRCRSPASVGLKAWDIQLRKNEYSLVVRDVVTGLIIRRVRFDGEYVEDATHHFDVSPDAKLLAVGDRIFKNERPPYGVQLWDVESGKLLRRLCLHLPDDPEWDTGRMPTIIPTTPLSRVGSTFGVHVETSHVTFRGLKLLGWPGVETPRPRVVNRVYPIGRMNERLDGLEIS